MPFPSSSRTWQCAIEAPASKASCVDSICSAMVIGTAGLSLFWGREPVMATQMMQGSGVGHGDDDLWIQAAGIVKGLASRACAASRTLALAAP